MKEQNLITEAISEKKVYESPKLTVFGSISELTQQNGNGPASDSGMNAMAPS